MSCIEIIITVWIASALLTAVWFFWQGQRIARRTETLKDTGVWFDGWTWVVARDRRDAVTLLRQHYEGADDTVQYLNLVPPNSPIKLWIGDPEGPTIEKPAHVWARERGRGFLASTEY